MPTQDISRFLSQPEKHYAGVRMQQGRVILDSDWNERSSIETEDLRRTVSELACSKGTPNGGMLISGVSEDAPYDFNIANGSFYLGGMRLVVDSPVGGGETYQTQSDWLQVDVDGNTITPGADRIDLVYVVGWEQPVSAIEDSELLEVALGGRDTSVRMRRMRRFQVRAVNEAPDPYFTGADGFEALIATLETNATFDFDTSELRSGGLIMIEENSIVQSTEDPCNIQEVDGYVGAENRAIRIELRTATTFTWGFDNASPLYRVKIGDSSSKLIFITEPADLPSMPREGQVVEVIRWGAKLPNMEKVCEGRGTLHKVATTYDPTTRELVLDTAVTAEWIDWFEAHDYESPNDPELDQFYFYLRVWDRGADTASDSELTFTGTTPVALGSTGLRVVQKAPGMPGDFWIIAARPSTPARFVPWDLGKEDGVPPHGPHRFYAPLALIRWDSGGVPTVEDVRTRLRPLCENGCCRVSVGDGNESHGQVSTLQDAIELLGDFGGKICVLPGVHEGTANLTGKTGVTIEGCGPRSILKNVVIEGANTDPEVYYTPVLTISDCERVTVKDLRIEAFHAFGVLVERSVELEACFQIRLEHLQIQCNGQSFWNQNEVYFHEEPCAGIVAVGVSELDILDCEVVMAPVISQSHAVALLGTHMRVQRCTVIAESGDVSIARANGGINIRSSSRDVEISGCHIEGGFSNGISLGHRMLVERSEGSSDVDWMVITHDLPLDGTLGGVNTAEGDSQHHDPYANPASGDPDWVWIPAGPVEDIRIHDNVIRDMGGSGISTAVFFPAAFNWDGEGAVDNVPRFIIAAEIDIARNLIERNAKFNSVPANFMQFDRALGGITLAASVNAWIHENTIRNNCPGYHTPKCGIGLVAAQNAVIEDNRIVDNGDQLPEEAPGVTRGLRGGIAIWEATTVRSNSEGQPAFPVTIPDRTFPGTVKNYSTASPESAVIVRGNAVSQPLGKALLIRGGFGPITVTGNSFEGFGDHVPAMVLPSTDVRWRPSVGLTLSLPARAALVEVMGLGLALDVDWTELEPPEPAWAVVGDSLESGPYVGDVHFTHNTMKLSWFFEGGYAFVIALSSLGSVVFDSNTVHVTTMNPYGSGNLLPSDEDEPNRSWQVDVPEVGSACSYFIASCYLGASSTVQATANRIIEEQFGVVFSLVCGPALQPNDNAATMIQNGGLVAGNIMTHCQAAHVSMEVPAGTNVAIMQNEDVSGCPWEIAPVNMGGKRFMDITP